MVYLCCCGSSSCIGMMACFPLQGGTVAPSSNHSRDVVSYETETARVLANTSTTTGVSESARIAY